MVPLNVLVFISCVLFLWIPHTHTHTLTHEIKLQPLLDWFGMTKVEQKRDHRFQGVWFTFAGQNWIVLGQTDLIHSVIVNLLQFYHSIVYPFGGESSVQRSSWAVVITLSPLIAYSEHALTKTQCLINTWRSVFGVLCVKYHLKWCILCTRFNCVHS